MKSIIAALVLLFLVLQYQLWFAKGSLMSAWHMRRDIQAQQLANNKLKNRNDQLKVDIKDLKHGKHALEERARNDLGMVKKNETFYQVVKSDRESK